MGTEYFVINKKAKTYFYLGKGPWFFLNNEKEAFSDYLYLKWIILLEVYGLNDDEGGDEEIREKVEELVQDLLKMMSGAEVGDIEVVADTVDDIDICRAKKYRCVGSRYGGKKGSKEYEEELAHINKHLEDTELNRKWWNEDNFRQYSKFEKY